MSYDNAAVNIDRNVNVGGNAYALQSYIVYRGDTEKGHYVTYVLDGWFFKKQKKKKTKKPSLLLTIVFLFSFLIFFFHCLLV